MDAGIRWIFGTVDLGGFDRAVPMPAGVEGTWPLGARRPVFRRIEAGDHEAALSIELGLRARSWIEAAPRLTEGLPFRSVRYIESEAGTPDVAAMRRAWAADRAMVTQMTEEVGW